MRRTSRRWGETALALMLSGALASPGVANQHAYRDTTAAFRQAITDPTGVADDDFDAYSDSANWEVNTNVTETDQVNDELLIGWLARHLIPPHGEGPNALGYLDEIRVDADDYAQGKGYSVTRSHVIGHGGHFDKFLARATFDIESTFGVDQITNYSFVFVGAHTDTIYGEVGLDTTLVSSKVVPPNASPTVGNCLLTYDNATGRFGVSIAVTGLAYHQITGATLNIGPPGQNGPPIGELGRPGDWTDMQSQSTCLQLDDLSTQPLLLGLVRKGLVYVTVMTQNHPLGEVRGQLRTVVTSALPRP
ncbi:MAG: CHRD domain-containing protein [Armatimonadetes bacterium]|nr:CHRD domain-containing protein [Armatimonadota bacterium]